MKNAGNGSSIHPFARTKMTDMKVLLKGISVLMVFAVAFLCFLMFPQAAKALASYNTNLIINGNAEANDTAMTGWTASFEPPTFMVLTPESGDSPEPNSIDGGNVFSYYPETPATEYITQTIDISNLAADIAAGAVSIHVSAYARKFMSSSIDRVALELLDESGNVLATYLNSGTTGDSNLDWETLTIDRNSIDSRTRQVRLILVAAISDAAPYADFVQFDGINLFLTKSITSANVGNIVAPVTGAIPVAYGDLTPGSSAYTVTNLTWYHVSGNPAQWINGRFKAEYSYRVMIELTASEGYKFETALPMLPVNDLYPGFVSGGDVEGNKLTFSINFPNTADLAVTDISVETQPVLSCIDGQALDLTGFAVKLTYNDTSTRVVAPGEFALRGIIASPANGTIMTMANHGQQVSLTANGHTAYTNALTMVPATYTITASPTSKDFGSVVLGYGSEPAAQTVTILNTGNSPVTLTAPASTNYLLGALSSTSLNAGASATFTVQPKTGLGLGTNSETITVNTNHSTSAGVNVTFTVDEPTYTIALSPDSIDFGSMVEGYEFAPFNQWVTITNTGNSTVIVDPAPSSLHYNISGFFPMSIEAGGTVNFFVEPMMDLTAGPYYETFTLVTDHLTSASVDLRFMVDIPTYSISSSPVSLDLGSMVAGSPFPPMGDFVAITNTGNANVTLNTPTNEYFDIIPIGPSILYPTGVLWFQVLPKTGLAAGTYDETITFSTTNAISASVSVTFTVQAATYTVEADTGSLNFGSVVQGYGSAPAPQTVTITNTGNSSLTFSAAPAASGYNIMGPFPITIPAGIFFTFGVQPKPGLAAGTYNETITVNTDHMASAGIDLAFTVQAATYTVEADTDNLNFGSLIEGYAPAPAAQTVTLTNTGNTIVTLLTPANAYYDITALDPLTIPPAGSAQFTVQPKTGLTTGPYSETITFGTTNATSDTVHVTFTVQDDTYTVDADTDNLSFLSVIEGYASAPSAQTVTITNTGNSSVTLIPPIEGNYIITALDPLTIAPMETTRFTVQPKTGFATGTYNETITFSTTNATSDTVHVTFTVQDDTYTVDADTDSLSFLSVIEGYASAPSAQTVTITNTGNSSVTLIPPIGGNYIITALDSLTITPMETTRFTVQPKTGLATGTYDETITFSTTNATSDTVHVTFTVQDDTYTVDADTGSLTFGSMIEGYASAPSAQTVTITNMGNKNVTLLTPTNAYYDITALDPLTVAPAGSARFTVQPKTGLATGPYSETITFGTTNTTSDSVNVSFTVQSASFAILASPLLVSFQSIAQVEAPPAAQTITISNTGNKPVTLTQPAAVNYLVGSLSAFSISPLEEATFTLQPKADLAEGSYTETINILGSNSAATQVEVRFTVTPALTYSIGASPLSLTFDSLAEGYIQPESKTVTVTNTGNQSISLYQPTAAHYVIGTLSTTALAPGSSATFSVTPKAGLSVGTFTETVQILGSGGVHTQVDVTFTCTAPNDYVILSGDGSAYQQNGSGPSSLTITSNGNINNFTGLTLNGDLVDESNYDVTQGSTIITLHQDFLDTLTPGTYTLSFHYTDGLAEAEFVIQDQMPVTGDNNALTVFGTLTLLCLIALILIRKKQTAR